MTKTPVIRVRDVMLHEFDMVSGQDTVSEALAKMKHVKTRLLMVDKRHDDDEYGIVRLGDIARQVLAKDRSPDRVNVYEIMSKPVISVPPTMDIRYCARLFESFGLQRAPVIEDGKVLGIIGYDEMLLHWLNLDKVDHDE
jgi:signal-transduction protein with cAMP-binding, CBS, and nucleotidyltransferase domain